MARLAGFASGYVLSPALGTRALSLTPRSEATRRAASGACFAGALICIAPLLLDNTSPAWALPVAACALAGVVLRRGLPHRPVDVAGWALAGICGIVLLAMLEGASRVILPAPALPLEMYEPHKRALYALRPNTDLTQHFPTPGMAQAEEIAIRINGAGWRGEEVAAEKAEDEIRILCLGDSYTFGWGALEESTYPAQLEKLLEGAARGRRVRVINGGTGGYGPWQERIMLEERGLPLAPDLVVLQIFPGNDFSDSLLREGTTTLEAFPVDSFDFAAAYRVMEHPVAKLNEWLRQHSRLFLEIESKVMGRWMLVRMYNRLRFVSLPGYRPVTPPGPRSWVVEPDLKEWYPAMEMAWERLGEDVRGMHEACAERGIPVAAFALPWLAGDERYQTEVGRYAAEHYERHKAARMTEAMLAETVELPVPMVEALGAHEDAESLILPLDGHLNHEGNALVAERVAEVLRPWLGQFTAEE